MVVPLAPCWVQVFPFRSQWQTPGRLYKHWLCCNHLHSNLVCMTVRGLIIASDWFHLSCNHILFCFTNLNCFMASIKGLVSFPLTVISEPLSVKPGKSPLKLWALAVSQRAVGPPRSLAVCAAGVRGPAGTCRGRLAAGSEHGVAAVGCWMDLSCLSLWQLVL